MNYFVELFKELNNKGIHYSVLRNWESLPESSGGHDIDIWVSSSNLSLFISVLDNIATMHEGYKVSYTYSKDCPRYLYLSKDWGIQYDVHIEDTQYRNAPYMKGAMIDNNTSDYRGVKVLKPSIEGFVSFFKEVLNNGSCKEEYCENATNVVSRTAPETLDSYLECFSTTTRSLIIEKLKEPDYTSKVLKQIRTRCIKDISTLSASYSYYWQRILRISAAIGFNNTLKKPGYVIAVMGTDGSGKSTIIDAITPWLEEAFHHGVIYRHLRPTVIPDLGVLLGKRKSESGRIVTNPHEHKPSRLVGSLIKWGYYLLDYTWGYLKLVWPQVSFKSKLFIFDRYYYDYYIDQRRMGISLPRWIIRFGALFVPKPDLVICLGGDSKKIYERKPETSLNEVTRQVEALMTFCTNRGNAVWVDTTTNIEDTIALTKRAILDMMSKRYNDIGL